MKSNHPAVGDVEKEIIVKAMHEARIERLNSMKIDHEPEGNIGVVFLVLFFFFFFRDINIYFNDKNTYI